MDFANSVTNISTSSAGCTSSDNPPKGEHHVTYVSEEYETTCWGCGLHLILSPYAPIFKCGWCGAVTNQNSQKNGNKYFWLRRLRDRSFVCVIVLFMLFIICGGIWSIYPIIFSTSYFCGLFCLSIAAILSVSTICTFFLAAFQSAGAPPKIPWGSYPTVGKGGLENYTFCHYCQRPKSPRTHHCRSCGMCVLDMDHHCPFIGNCVGATNHRYFIFFLFSAVMSTMYASILTSYAALCIWPSFEYSLSHTPLKSFSKDESIFRILGKAILSFFGSLLSLPARGLVIVYLFIASVSVGIGLTVLLWQQLCYIYEGTTYLNHLSFQGSDEIVERDCQNLIRFFGFPRSASRYLTAFWSYRKTHDK